ncbi:MAG: hypothetical protein LH702_07805, partial [Phormidesmis sp. CAN_BIN44]|nr:hypothetical protein [Phormidesmis sp. CAN_BIN44]
MTLAASRPKPTHKSNACPICGDVKGKCRTFAEKPLVLCMVADFAPGWKAFGSTKDGLWTQFAPETGSPFDRDAWQRRQRDEKPVTVPQTMSLEERDRFYRDWLSKSSLNERDRADLQRRGITDPSIALSCEFGYAVPFKGLDGTYLGAQWRYADPGEGGRYRWHNLPGGKYYPGTNELPIAVYKVAKPTMIALVEGTGLKPMLAAEGLNAITIGAAGGNHLSSPIQLKAGIAAYPGLPLVAIPDAGDVINPHVMGRHKRTAHQFPETKFLWWGQVTKQENDIDEVTSAELASAQLLTWAEFEAIARTATYHTETRRLQTALNSLTHPTSQELNHRYLSDIKAPQTGEILTISSACNTGKTTQLKGFVTDWRSRHPNGFILMIGGRNALLMQTGQKTGIPHIQELDRWYPNGLRFALQQENAIALCLDSLHRINLDWLPEHTLIILDEGEATLQQALEGGTLGSRQNGALEHFKAVLNVAMERSGSILLMEDSLTDLSVHFLKEATDDRYPVRLVVNHHLSQPWDVTIGAGSPSGFVARLRALLDAGQKVILTSDSQIQGEALDRLFRSDYKVVRVDALTVEDPTIASFRLDPNAHIAVHQPDLLILTPTVQSGVDITIQHFDINLHYATHLEARLQNQLLNRYRVPVPREIYCATFAPSEGGDRGLRPAQLLKEWSLKARTTLMRSQVETFIQDGLDTWNDVELTKQRLDAIENWRKAEADSPALFWARHAATFKARQNGSKCQLLKSLTATLESKGHHVTPNSGWERNGTETKQLSEAKTAIRCGRATDRATADTTGLEVETARRILNSNDSLYAERCKAHKVLLLDELPGIPLTPEFVLEAVINHNGALKRATTLLFLTQHPEIATYLDRQSFKGQLDKPFVATWRLSHKRSAVEVLLITGIKALMECDEYRETDEVVVTLKREALKNRVEIKRYLGLNVNEQQTGIEIAGKLLKKLWYQQVVVRREGARGEQTRIYKAVPLNQAISDEILKALETKWAEQISAGSQHFKREESSSKTVTTDSQIPADWFSEDSLRSIRAMWKGCKSDEIRLLMEKHIPLEALR